MGRPGSSRPAPEPPAWHGVWCAQGPAAGRGAEGGGVERHRLVSRHARAPPTRIAPAIPHCPPRHRSGSTARTAWRLLGALPRRMLGLCVNHADAAPCRRYERYGPTISCPPEAPMARYGNPWDGGKELCHLERKPAGQPSRPPLLWARLGCMGWPRPRVLCCAALTAPCFLEASSLGPGPILPAHPQAASPPHTILRGARLPACRPESPLHHPVVWQQWRLFL